MSFVDWFKYMLDMDVDKFDMFQAYVSRKLDVTVSERWKSDFERMYDCATRLYLRENDEKITKLFLKYDDASVESKQDGVKDIFLDMALEPSPADVWVRTEAPAEISKAVGIEIHVKTSADKTTQEIVPNTLAVSICVGDKAAETGTAFAQEDLTFESAAKECRYPRVYQSMYITTNEAMQRAESFCTRTSYDLSIQLQKTRYKATEEMQASVGVVVTKLEEFLLEQEYSNALMWERIETKPNDPLNQAWIQELMNIFEKICRRYLYDMEMSVCGVHKRRLATYFFAFQMKYYKIAKQRRLQKLHVEIEKKCLQTCTEEKLLAGLLVFSFLNPHLVTKEICPNMLIADVPQKDFDDIKGTGLESLWEELSQQTDLPIFRTSDAT